MGRYLVSESQGWKFVFQWDEHSTQSGVFRPQRTEDIIDLSLLSSSSLSSLVLLRKSFQIYKKLIVENPVNSDAIRIHAGSWVWQTCNYLQALFCQKNQKEDCIPVGCVLLAAVAIRGVSTHTPRAGTPLEQATPLSHPPRAGTTTPG